MMITTRTAPHPQRLERPAVPEEECLLGGEAVIAMWRHPEAVIQAAVRRAWRVAANQTPRAVGVPGQRHYSSSSNTTNSTREETNSSAAYHCQICEQGGQQPCATVAAWLASIPAHRYSRASTDTEKSTAATANGPGGPAAPASRALQCLTQPASVFRSLLQMSLVLEFKRGSARLRWITEQSPCIADRIRGFLCGEDTPFVPLPPVTAHEEWEEMLALMGFDAIRDNRTRIITDFSRHWKRRTIPYEQFVFFYAFRDHLPPAPVKNIVTRSVKPGMVAMLSMNAQAMWLLHHHEFFIPEDHYWDVFRFLEPAAAVAIAAAAAANKEDGEAAETSSQHGKRTRRNALDGDVCGERNATALYLKIRHLGLYLSATQRHLCFFSPIEKRIAATAASRHDVSSLE